MRLLSLGVSMRRGAFIGIVLMWGKLARALHQRQHGADIGGYLGNVDLGGPMTLTSTQKKTVLAAFLGWMLDAFDFFLLVFLLGDIAKEFGVQISQVAYA